MLLNATSVAFASFLLCLAMVPALRILALTAGLTDKPSGRKTHTGEIPLIGGLAIFLAAVVSVFFVYDATSVYLFLILAAPLILVGVADDMYEVNPGVRIVVQIMVSVGMIYLTDIHIYQIGDIFGQGAIVLNSVIAPLFTVFCVIGVINAINMLDGCDGLAGSVSLITVLALTVVAGLNGDSSGQGIGAMLAGGLVAFLLYNTHTFGTKFRIFLGDAGSMFLGFALVWLFVSLSQSDQSPSLSPVAAGWIFGLPLVDVISVMVGRIRKGISPFAAGRDHLHHQLLDRGFSIQTTVISLALVHSLFVGVGLLVNQYNNIEPVAFWLFVVLVVLHHFRTPEFLNYLKKSIVRI